MTKITKVTRFEIIGINNEDKKLLNKILRDLQFESRNQGNDVIKCLYENSRFGKMKIIDDYNISDKSLQAQINDAMKRIFTKGNTSGIETITQKVMSEWTANQKKFGIGERVILSYRNSNAPLYVRNNQIKLIKEGNDCFISVRLISNEYAKQLEEGLEVVIGKGKDKKTIAYKKNEKGMWIKFKVIVKGELNKPIFERAMNGEYKIGTSQFIYHESKRKWFFNLNYTFEKEKVELDENKIMGIDVGLNVPATLAVSHDKYYRQFVGDGKEIIALEKQHIARKKRIQESRKWAGEGSVGHGIKTRTKAVDRISGKIANFKQTKNHNWSKYIVDEAVKMGCGTIQMEDLSGISDENTFLKNWTFYQLQQYITYKAEEKGIKVVKIKPNHTSARCNKCGHIHFSNGKGKWRPTQEQFHCQNCDYKVNADVNAARNIAMKDIEKIIEEQLKAQEKHTKHMLKYADV